MFLLVLEFIKCLWELIGLLSDYHNMILDWMGSQQSDRDLNNLTRGHVGHICIYIYAKRSIQIYILIFYFIFLSEVVCFTLHLCIQIFVYFSEIFSFYYSSKTVSTLDTALLICFHLDAMFPHIVWNQNQKATYDFTSSYKVYVG